jgi:hypothetical protein
MQLQRVCHDTLPWLISFSLGERVIGSIHIRPYLEHDAEALCEAVLESKAQLSAWLPWSFAKKSIL